MINLEYKGETYELPTKFSEITLNKYMKIVALDVKDKPISKLVDILSILTGLSIDEIKDISVDQVGAITNHLQFLFKSETKVLIDQVKINGKWYGFNKNLHKIKFGEYIDLEEFSKKEQLSKNLHILMAMLYRPLKQRKKSSTLHNFIKNYIYDREKLVKEYEIEKYDENNIMIRADIFKKYMTVDVILGAMFFFIILKRIYINNLKQSSTKKEMMKEVIKYMKASGVNFKPIGVG